MKFDAAKLLNDLKTMSESHLKTAGNFRLLHQDVLNHKASSQSWSALECLEHLNMYGDYYIPEISRRLQAAPDSSNTLFESGLLGNYFAQSMLPKEKLNRMKTFKDKNPNGRELDVSVLDKFIDQQNELLKLLEMAGRKDLTRIKTSVSITKLLKLKLGDTFRVLIYHNERHLVQAKKAIEHGRPAISSLSG